MLYIDSWYTSPTLFHWLQGEEDKRLRHDAFELQGDAMRPSIQDRSKWNGEEHLFWFVMYKVEGQKKEKLSTASLLNTGR